MREGGSGSEEHEEDGGDSYGDPDCGHRQQKTLTGVRFPFFAQSRLQLPVVHDPVTMAASPAPASAVPSAIYGQFVPLTTSGRTRPTPNPAAIPAETSTPPREIGALVRELRPVDFTARHLRGRA